MTAKKRKTPELEKPGPYHAVGLTLLDMHVGLMIEQACKTYLDDGDHVHYSATMYPLPSDGGWAPQMFLYVMVLPVSDADGIHMGQFISPYLVNQELVDTYIQGFAETSAAERQHIRDLRAGGATETQGVAIL